jgi:hypothetical protein
MRFENNLGHVWYYNLVTVFMLWNIIFTVLQLVSIKAANVCKMIYTISIQVYNWFCCAVYEFSLHNRAPISAVCWWTGLGSMRTHSFFPFSWVMRRLLAHAGWLYSQSSNRCLAPKSWLRSRRSMGVVRDARRNSHRGKSQIFDLVLWYCVRWWSSGPRCGRRPLLSCRGTFFVFEGSSSILFYSYIQVICLYGSFCKTRTHTQTHKHPSTHTHMCVCVCVCVCIYIYISLKMYFYKRSSRVLCVCN